MEIGSGVEARRNARKEWYVYNSISYVGTLPSLTHLTDIKESFTQSKCFVVNFQPLLKRGRFLKTISYWCKFLLLIYRKLDFGAVAEA